MLTRSTASHSSSLCSGHLDIPGDRRTRAGDMAWAVVVRICARAARDTCLWGAVVLWLGPFPRLTLRGRLTRYSVVASRRAILSQVSHMDIRKDRHVDNNTDHDRQIPHTRLQPAFLPDDPGCDHPQSLSLKRRLCTSQMRPLLTQPPL